MYNDNDLGDSISVLEEFESLYMKGRNRWERLKVQTDAKRVLNEAAYVIFIDFAIQWNAGRDNIRESETQ